tara:strand:- start:2008 stop:2193 length:186 start_codon:yes stop_codon:yes gene_type:complete
MSELALTTNQILYIVVLAILFIILNVFVGIKYNLNNYNVIIIFISIVVIIVLATLSAIKEN